MHVDGVEALARTLEWIAEQLRAGVVTGVSLELSDGKGRLSVSFQSGPVGARIAFNDDDRDPETENTR
jgi:hypothetical protein